MSDDDARLIEKIVSRESDLVAIYREVYPSMKSADRADLPDKVVEDLQTLESPETIQPSKAAAILKAIQGSTAEDQFQFESCYSVPMPDGSSLGEFVRRRLDGLDLSYHDFWPYLRDRGWLKAR